MIILQFGYPEAEPAETPVKEPFISIDLFENPTDPDNEDSVRQ